MSSHAEYTAVWCILCMVACLLTIVTSQPASAAGREFFVAVNGNDRNPGTKAKPFATLEAARDAIGSLKRNGGLPKGGVIIRIRGGQYHLKRPFELTAEDSGSEQCPIVYAAFQQEKPVLSGGRPITGWKPGERGLWEAEIAEAKTNSRYFRQLFVGGQWRPRPRLPKEGKYSLAGGAQPDTSAFQFAPGDIQESWTNRDDIEVVVLQFWTEARLRIAKLDPTSRVVTFTGGSWRPLTWSMGYFVENVKEALSTPGEWYLDRQTGILSYVPQPGEDVSKLEAVAPVLEQLVRLRGDAANGQLVEHIAFRGLTFAHAAWKLPPEGLAYPQAELPVKAMFAAEGAAHCSVEDCDFGPADSWAVEFGRGCKKNRIIGSTFHGLGAGGIRIGEDSNVVVKEGKVVGFRPESEENGGHVISDNVLCDGAKSYFGGPAIWVGQSRDNLINHNEISGTWQWAVSVGWNWGYCPPNVTRGNIVEYNHVHHIGTLLGSHASIYALGIQPGTTIRFNHVHHGAGHGIALDQGSTGIVVENNLVHHHRAGGLHFNWDCLGNWVSNNVFALNGDTGQWTRYGDAPQAEDANTNVLMRNLFYWNGGPLLREARWPNYRMIIDYNLYYDVSGQPVKPLGLPWEEWTTKAVGTSFRMDAHSVIGDPLFRDAESGDFRLKPESPAFELGFREFDLSGVGPRMRR